MSDNDEEKTDLTTFSIQILLLAIIFIIAIVGNALVCFVVYHFKHLRTIPNFFIVNLSVIDLCNALINVPLFVGYYIIKAEIFRGKWVSYVCCSLHNYMIYLNVLALLVLMADRYGAIKFKLRYHTWKTKSKACLGIALIWILGTVLLIALGFRRDRILSPYEGLSVMEYRRILYKTEGWKVAIGIVGIPFLGIAVLGFLVWRAVRASRWRIEAITKGNECTPQGKQMLNMLRTKEVQTARNIAIIVAAYFVCFVPSIVHGILLKRGIDAPWAEYFAFFFTYFSSACNPIVYSLRTCRFREVIKELFKCEPTRRDPVLPVALVNVKMVQVD